VHVYDDSPTASNFGIGSYAEHAATVDLGTVASVFGPHYVAGADGLSSLVILTPGDAVHGTLAISGGHVFYTPPANVSGDQSFNFDYQVTDADGDVATATINVDVIDHVPTITQLTPERTPGEVTVHEAGLAGGSGIGDTTTTAAGSFKIDTHGEGLGTLSIGGGAVNLAAGFPQLVHSDSLGDLSVTGISNVAGVYTVSYSYTLTHNLLESPAADNAQDLETSPSFAIAATDASGDPVGSNIIVHVFDDAPTAHADSNNTTSGHLLSVLAAAGVEANDGFGADGKSGAGVVGVRLAGGDTTTPVQVGTGTVIHGTYGDLTLQTDGSYTYQAKSNTGGVDHFVYTIKDGDGDLSTTTLDITVNQTGPATASGSTTVDEAALDLVQDAADLVAGTKTGSNPASGAETNTGTLGLPAGVTVQTPHRTRLRFIWPWISIG
jgi:VCBS repeat-containing protein